MTITLEDMKSKLLTADEVLSKVEAVEGVAWADFVMDDSEEISAEFPSGWNGGIDDREDTDVTTASLRISGTEYPLTKKAAYDLTSTIGLRRAYVTRTPGALITPHVNYWLAHQDDKRRILINKDGTAAALCRPGKSDPYPSYPLIESVVKTFKDMTGSDELYFDYKDEVSLDRVALRLISPDTVTIPSLRNGTKTDDEWSVGIQFENSMTGKTALSLSGYLFAWWCTNGAITTHSESSRYRRRASGDLADASEWITGAAPAVTDSLAHEIESVASLVDEQLGAIGQVTQELFSEYALPQEVRASVLENLVESDDSTAYGLMNAFTQAANDDLPDSLRQKLMTIGGDLTMQFSERCESCHRLPVH